ncbi:hypothetical protein D3C87_1723930 [compost metagenome]
MLKEISKLYPRLKCQARVYGRHRKIGRRRRAYCIRIEREPVKFVTQLLVILKYLFKDIRLECVEQHDENIFVAIEGTQSLDVFAMDADI